MQTLTDILVKRRNEQKKYFYNPKLYAQQAKRIAQKILGKAEVFLFGSTVSGCATPSSDIDLLIVSPHLPKTQAKQAKIKEKIYQQIGLFSPFEIHLITPAGLSWYERFIDKKIRI